MGLSPIEERRLGYFTTAASAIVIINLVAEGPVFTSVFWAVMLFLLGLLQIVFSKVG